MTSSTLCADVGVDHACQSMQASAAAVVSYIGYASYSPTKYALRGLADALRNELRGFGIQASPGPQLPHPPHIPTRAVIFT